MPPSTNESATAGPAYEAAACPVSTKMPAPMIAPMPSETRFIAESVRFNECSPLVSASAFKAAIDFLTNRFAIQCLQVVWKRFRTTNDERLNAELQMTDERRKGKPSSGFLKSSFIVQLTSSEEA